MRSQCGPAQAPDLRPTRPTDGIAAVDASQAIRRGRVRIPRSPRGRRPNSSDGTGRHRPARPQSTATRSPDKHPVLQSRERWKIAASQSLTDRGDRGSELTHHCSRIDRAGAGLRDHDHSALCRHHRAQRASKAFTDAALDSIPHHCAADPPRDRDPQARARRFADAHRVHHEMRALRADSMTLQRKKFCTAADTILRAEALGRGQRG